MAEKLRPVGPGRVLALTYGLFTLAAGARSVLQIITRPEPALFAYSLSALAACTYAVGALLVLRADQHHSRTPAIVACCAELAGVVVVGTLSVAVPRWFPDETVWSHYGQGYGFVPTVLPLFALWWLTKKGP